jgi:hypothetical protein
MALDDEKRLEHLRTHAWSWFSFHADQRTKMFNFFVASSAFLVAGYATAASNKLWVVAVVVGVLGALNCLCFWKLDTRNAELVDYGKEQVREFEKIVFRNWPAASPAPSPTQQTDVIAAAAAAAVTAVGQPNDPAAVAQRVKAAVAAVAPPPPAAPPAPSILASLPPTGVSLADADRDADDEASARGIQPTGAPTGEPAVAKPPNPPFYWVKRTFLRFRRGKTGIVLPTIELLLGVVFAAGSVYAAVHLGDSAKPSTEQVLEQLKEVAAAANSANALHTKALEQQASNAATRDAELANAVRAVAAALSALKPPPTASQPPPRKRPPVTAAP